MTFPLWATEDCQTALCLFCAGFLGENVEQYVRDAGVTAIAIDNDLDKLTRMQALYPDDWEFVCADAYLIAAQLRGIGFDLVTADPQLNQMRRCFEMRGILHTMAEKHLVIGIADEDVQQARAEGATVIPRTTGSWWAAW